MRRLKNVFSSLVIAAVMVGCFCAGIALRELKPTTTQNSTSADVITNSLRPYVELTPSKASNAYNNYLYLMQTGDSFNLSVATDTISGTIQEKIEGSESTRERKYTNYAYIPAGQDNDNPQEYYYFNFSKIDLYYGQNSDTQLHTNLLDLYTSTQFARVHSDVGIVDAFTPYQLNVDFALNTNATGIQVSSQADGTDDYENAKATVTLNQEGLYTLSVTMVIKHTTNGGQTFSTLSTDDSKFSYSFMMFNYSTYLDAGLPRIYAKDADESRLAEGLTFSKYYYYNYSKNTTLPSISYDPYKYRISVQYSNIDNVAAVATVDFDPTSKTLSQSNLFYAEYDEGANQARLSFNDLGEYTLTIEYLYVADGATYTLPITADLQKLYLYGYQIFYTDPARRNPTTNQTIPQEFKTIEQIDNGYYQFKNAADITNKMTAAKVQNGPYTMSDLAEKALELINGGLQPVSTNQTPVSFASNVVPTASMIYEVVFDDENKEYTLQNGKTFDWLSLNEGGTYLVFADYTFTHYRDINGDPKSQSHHYQAFYFTIDTVGSTIATIAGDGKELADGGYTNQDVYILDEAASKNFDSRPIITISGTGFDKKPLWTGDGTINASSASRGERLITDKELEHYGITYFTNLSVIANPKYTEGSSLSEYLYLNQTGASISADPDKHTTDGHYTVRVYQPQSTSPAVTTFTIDTTGIGDIRAHTVKYLSSDLCSVSEQVGNHITNQPIIFSWLEKASGAPTYGHVKYFSLSPAAYYDHSVNNTELIYRLLNQQLLPVEAYLDMSASAEWPSYKNSIYNNNTVSSSQVKSSAGLYIVEVYDLAGNANFEVFMIDNTTPLFVEVKVGITTNTTRSILTNSTTIPVSESYGARIEWAKNKGIYVKFADDIVKSGLYESYSGDNLSDPEKAKLKQKIDDFFSGCITISGFGNFAMPDGPIKEVNGTYLAIPVYDNYYFKDALGNEYSLANGTTQSIDLFDEKGNGIDGTYKILLRDLSNGRGSAGGKLDGQGALIANASKEDYLNYPSAYLSVNVTSDSSRLTLLLGGGVDSIEAYEPDKEAYSFTGNFYEHSSGDERLNKSDEKNNDADIVRVSQQGYQYKYTYYTPVKAQRITNKGENNESRTDLRNLYVSFIPVSESSIIDSITLYYYPFKKATEKVTYRGTEIESTYYTLAETAEPTPIFNYSSDQSYTQGQVESRKVSISHNGIIEPGKYVIVRTYTQNVTKDNKYDYYERTLTLIVDKYNVISEVESTSSSAVSGESIVGGDILVSMYSLEGQSNINVSFPYINSNGLNSGSFYTKDYMSSTENIASSFTTNKLPLSINIPSYKYTISSIYDDENNTYSVKNNNTLSRFGNAYVVDPTIENGLSGYTVYVEGVKVATFNTKKEALDYLATTEINQYKLYATVTLTTTSGATLYFKSNGTTTDGYLNLYQVASLRDEVSTTSRLITAFSYAGRYDVTITQASATEDTATSFRDFYRFAFVVSSPAPDFEVYANGRIANSVVESDGIQTYYVNTPNLTVLWEDSNDRLIANIDKNEIYYTARNISTRITGITETSFDLDLLSLDNFSWNLPSDITITMQFEGHSDSYYQKVTKRIRVDYTAPNENLVDLMDNLTSAYPQITRLIQERQMRTLFGYGGIDDVITTTNWTANNLANEMQKVSYSFSVTDENDKLRNYAYNVPKSYFDNLYPSQSYEGAQHYYFKRIDDITSYRQVNIKGFSANNYTDLFAFRDYSIEADNYYEIVETDIAGNMTVYVVHVYEPSSQASHNAEKSAIAYTNTRLAGQTEYLYDEDLYNGANIYSSGGFALTKLNYLSDPWGIYTTVSNGIQVSYMKSPYPEAPLSLLTIEGGRISLKVRQISNLYSNLTSSYEKQLLRLINRYEGEPVNIYLTVWDSNLRYEPPSSDDTSATLKVWAPVDSAERSYYYPVEIKIYRFEDGGWIQYYERENYSGDPTLWADTALAVTLTYSDIDHYLTINVAFRGSEKLKYVIVDNFGKETIITQLANEEKITSEVIGDEHIDVIDEAASVTSLTYLSTSNLYYRYNNLKHDIKVKEIIDGVEYEYNHLLTQSLVRNTKTTMEVAFARGTSGNVDKVYKIYVYDVEDKEYLNPEKIIQLRIYDRLPVFSNTSTPSGNQNYIWFLDKNNKNIEISSIDGSASYVVMDDPVTGNSVTYSANAVIINTYSNNVRAFFSYGRYGSVGQYHYQDQYSYSVWFKAADKTLWEEITDTDINEGYPFTTSGQILICYENSDLFDGKCQIYNINIFDSSSLYYYITAKDKDGNETVVKRADIKYHYEKGNESHTYEEVYIVSVNWNYSEGNVKIVPNEELDFRYQLDRDPIPLDGGVVVEIYTSTTGYFVIVYIGTTEFTDDGNLLTYLTEDSGTYQTLRNQTSAAVIAEEDESSSLKLTFNDHFGISENKITVEVLKLYNNEYVPVFPTVYSDGTYAYIYLERSGSYRIAFHDSCSPANYHYFSKNSVYLDLIFLSGIPFHVTYTNEIGELVETEPVNRAIYNVSGGTNVTLTLQNLGTYYNNPGSISIKVTKDGKEYTGFTRIGYAYSFTETGYYKVTFTNGTYRNGSMVREEEFIFTIINPNESRYAYEFSPYSTEFSTYYITSVIRFNNDPEVDGRDITNDLIALAGNDVVIVNGQTYLSRLLLSYFDMRTGAGRYQITVNTGNSQYPDKIVKQSFTFSLWINLAQPPIKPSVSEGTSTSDTITVKFNAYDLFETVGDCYIKIGNTIRYVNADTLEELGGENASLSITNSGIYFIQIYTMSGTLLYSYKVVKTDPLNAWAIIAIVLGALAVVAIALITIKLRKRLKVK